MTDSSAADDRALAARAAAGCVESFSVLAARHQVGVMHYVRRLLGLGGGHEDDLTQETFLAAFRQLDRYDDSFAFSTWLFTIARHACLNHLRSARRRVDRETERTRSAIAVSVVSPDRAVAEREDRELLWDVARQTLPEKQFSALWLHYAEGLAVAEIGRVLGRPAATVKVLLFRGRRRLAAVLAPEDARPAPAPENASEPAPTIVRLPRAAAASRPPATATTPRRRGHA
jgi:RNA polymerase sigma-70 factor (ECF subfamily)